MRGSPARSRNEGSMTWTIDASALEGAIVRHCSPTLAGLKPASLFTFPGSFIGDELESVASAARRRDSLTAAVNFCRRQIAEGGMDIRILAWKRCGALVYVYRPQALAHALSQPQAARALARTGYRTDNAEACLNLLSERLSEPQGKADSARAAKPCPCEQQPCANEFPHEIGFFLGYPTADVIGFIENRGKNSIACGPWKVYANKDQALQTFARYRRCTRAYARAYRHGRSLSRLAVKPR